MKKFLLLIVCMLAVFFGYNVSSAQATLELTIANQQADIVANTFAFDIMMKASGDSIWLSGGDMVLIFNNANFTGPVTQINDGSGDGSTYSRLRNSWGTPGTQTTASLGNLPATYEGLTSPAAISTNEIIINIQAATFSTQVQFRKNVFRLVPDTVYQFGRFLISGITNQTGTMGLTWKTIGGTFTQISGFTNVSPWTSSALTLSTPAILPDAPLPVELTSFTASASRLNAQLNWATATEKNNYGFEIERRSVETANAAWAKVGFVRGAGTSNSPHSYGFFDKGASAGRYAYRLKQVDNNGAFKYSQSTEIEIGLAAKELTLSGNYPNPFNPTTNVEFTVAANGRAVLKVYNSIGQEVAELYNGEAQAGKIIQTRFDASKLASGIYYSRLQADGKSLVKRMMFIK
jgi:hypothetical protein